MMWSCIYLLPKVLLYNYDLFDVLKALAFGKAALHLYFIIVLFYFNLVTPALLKIIRTKYRFLPFVSTLAFFVLLYIVQLSGTDIWHFVHYTPVWFPFYYAGFYCSVYRPTNVINRKLIFIALILTYVLQVFENYIILNHYGYIQMAYGMIRIGGFLYAGCLCYLTYMECAFDGGVRIKNTICKFVQKIGDYSYSIFYSHILILMILRKIMLTLMPGVSLLPWRLTEVCGVLFISTICITCYEKIDLPNYINKTKL